MSILGITGNFDGQRSDIAGRSFTSSAADEIIKLVLANQNTQERIASHSYWSVEIKKLGLNVHKFHLHK